MAEITPPSSSYYDQLPICGVGKIPSGADRIVFLGQLLDAQQENLEKESGRDKEYSKITLELDEETEEVT